MSAIKMSAGHNGLPRFEASIVAPAMMRSMPGTMGMRYQRHNV